MSGLQSEKAVKEFILFAKAELSSGKPPADIKQAITKKVANGNDDPFDLGSLAKVEALTKLYKEIRESKSTDSSSIKMKAAVEAIDKIKAQELDALKVSDTKAGRHLKERAEEEKQQQQRRG